MSEHDVERLRLHLSLMAHSASQARIQTALAMLLVGTIPSATLSYSVYRESQHTGDWIDRTGFAAGLVTSIVTLGVSSYFLSTPWSEERLYDAFALGDYSTERKRALGIPKIERALQQKALEGRLSRDIGAWVFLIGGAINALQGAAFLSSDILGTRPVHMAGPITLLIGLGQIAFGIYTRSTPSTLENVWATYSQDPAIAARRPN